MTCRCCRRVTTVAALAWFSVASVTVAGTHTAARVTVPVTCMSPTAAADTTVLATFAMAAGDKGKTGMLKIYSQHDFVSIIV